MWAISMNKSNTLPNVHVLNLYREVRAANWSVFFISERPESTFDLTKRNLMEAGYEGWTSLILRYVLFCQILLYVPGRDSSEPAWHC